MWIIIIVDSQNLGGIQIISTSEIYPFYKAYKYSTRVYYLFISIKKSYWYKIQQVASYNLTQKKQELP